MKLERFTLVGATTRTGLLAAPAARPLRHRRSGSATTSRPSSREIAVRAAREARRAGRRRGRRGARAPRAAAPRASPSGSCTAPATSPRWRPTARRHATRSSSEARAPRGGRRGLDEMDRRMLTHDRSSTAARSASTRWRPRSARSATRSRTCTNRSSSARVSRPHAPRSRGARPPVGAPGPGEAGRAAGDATVGRTCGVSRPESAVSPGRRAACIPCRQISGKIAGHVYTTPPATPALLLPAGASRHRQDHVAARALSGGEVVQPATGARVVPPHEGT